MSVCKNYQGTESIKPMAHTKAAFPFRPLKYNNTGTSAGASVVK